MTVAGPYTGRDAFGPEALVAASVACESVPFLAASQANPRLAQHSGTGRNLAPAALED
jgi:hypothetical protein